MTFMEMNQITGMIKPSHFIYFYRIILEVCNCQNLNTELLKQVGWGKSNVAPEQRMRLKGESLSGSAGSETPPANPLNQDRALADYSLSEKFHFRKITPNLF